MRHFSFFFSRCARALAAFASTFLVADATSSALADSPSPPDCSRIGWSPLGSGVQIATGNQWQPFLPGQIKVLAVGNDGAGPAIFVAGAFDLAGGAPAKNIAKWDGSNWSAFGSGLSSPSGNIYSILPVQHDSTFSLFASGRFYPTEVPLQIGKVAHWDGTAWHALDKGLYNGDVRSLAWFDDGSGPALYAAGNFIVADDNQAGLGVARWNRDHWEPIGTGLQAFISGDVNVAWGASLAVFDDHLGSGPALYLSGYFNSVDGVPAQNFARWDGTSWSQVADGLQDVGLPLDVISTPHGDALLVGTHVWNGRSLSPVFPPGLVVPDHTSFAVSSDETAPLYFFFGIDSWDGAGVDFNGSMVRHDSRGFHPMTSGFEVQPSNSWSSHVIENTEFFVDAAGRRHLVIAGDFESIGGNLANSIAMWSPIAPISDCDLNQFQDHCDRAADPAADCSVSSSLASCTLTADYQSDLQPPGTLWGPNGAADFLWMNHFVVQPHQQVITHILLPWSWWAADRLPVRLLLYNDPNNDRNPDDAVLLASTVAENFPNQDRSWPDYTTVSIPITPTLVGEVGESFFVAALTTNLNPSPSYMAFQTYIELPLSPVRSWMMFSWPNMLDVEHPADPFTTTYIEPQIYPFILRAVSSDCNLNGTWDQCDIDSGSSLDLNNNTIPDECESPCDADLVPLGGDGQINIDDVLAVLTRWGPCDPGACWTDLDHSNATDIGDLSALILHWGNCTD